MQHGLTEQRRPEHILARGRTYGIKAQCREDIPGRGLTIVLIPAIAVRRSMIESVDSLPYPILTFPGFTGIVIEIQHMLYRLIAMRILTHTRDLHLADLVDHLAIIAVVENRRHNEYTVEHPDEFFFTTHEIDES